VWVFVVEKGALALIRYLDFCQWLQLRVEYQLRISLKRRMHGLTPSIPFAHAYAEWTSLLELACTCRS